MKTLLKLCAAGLVTVLLSACVSTEEQRASYRQLSCYELAKEIGRQEANVDRAQSDELSADIDSIFADNKKQRREADVDGLVANLDESFSQEKLNMLKDIEYDKGCRR